MPKPIRQIRIEGNIAYVPLTQGYEAVIDAADVPLVEGWNWCAMVQSHSVYAFRTDCASEKPFTVRMHRFLMDAPADMAVDHINGNGIDNERRNMRLATKSQNMRNQRISRANTSGFKGVRWRRDKCKWQANIEIDGKTKHLGYFSTAEEAQTAYADASERFHGVWGRVA